MVIASARLELEVTQIAGFLGEPNAAGLSQLAQIRAIRRRSQDRSDGQAISEWAAESNSLLRERGLLVHGGFLGRVEGEAPAFIAHRRGEIVNIDLGRLDSLIESASQLAVQGQDHSSSLFGEFISRLSGETNE
ncbi:hypothetical protein AB0O95_07875 [Rhodoglobus sp. NPDC076762]